MGGPRIVKVKTDYILRTRSTRGTMLTHGGTEEASPSPDEMSDAEEPKPAQ